MSEHELDELIAGGRVAIDEALADERRFVVPDFAAVIALAHERDPEAVPATALAEVEALAPVVEFKARVGVEDLLSEDGLDGLLADARSLAEADVAARRMAGIPAVPLADPPAPASAGGRRWLGPALAIAAVLGLAVIGPRLFAAFVDGARVEAGPHNSAEYLEEGAGRDERAQPRAPLFERADPPSHEADTATVEPRRMPHEQAGHEQAGHEQAGHEQAGHEQAGHERAGHEQVAKAGGDSGAGGVRDAGEVHGDRLAELAAEAQARWAEGDLAGAEQRFREIIRIAGKGRHADLAYGDLFTLARQRHDAAAEAALWREYLAAFPHGRFADDARAGLCRRAADDAQRDCWQDYLDDFPKGVHRRAAERATAPASDE